MKLSAGFWILVAVAALATAAEAPGLKVTKKYPVPRPRWCAACRHTRFQDETEAGVIHRVGCGTPVATWLWARPIVFSWPAEFEHGAQTTNNDRLRHAGHRNLLTGMGA